MAINRPKGRHLNLSYSHWCMNPMGCIKALKRVDLIFWSNGLKYPCTPSFMYLCLLKKKTFDAMVPFLDLMQWYADLTVNRPFLFGCQIIVLFSAILGIEICKIWVASNGMKIELTSMISTRLHGSHWFLYIFLNIYFQ